ncbi:MAG: hypothetical protein RL427_657 [Bacteroidota bacterium]|jgi:hypothetical protein
MECLSSKTHAMKTKLLFIFFLLFQFAVAQNITFPDPVLKNFLVNSAIDFSQDPNNIVAYPPIDADADGEISMEEALNVIGLNFYYQDITNLEGLQYFTNLKVISTYYANFPDFYQPTLVNLEQLSLLNSVGTSSLTSVDVSSNTNLTKLQCTSDLITSLDLSNNTLLKNVDIYCPALTSVDFSNLVNLKTLSYLGRLSTIDISDSVNLLNLTCGGASVYNTFPQENLLTSLDLSNQAKLINLNLTGNNLTSLDLSNCPNLEYIYVAQNKLTSLNLDNVNYVKYFFCDDNLLASLNVNSMFNLQIFSCKNNLLNSLSTKNSIIEDTIDFSGNPDLQSICCDVNEQVYMQNQCNLNGNASAVVVSDCGTESSSSKIAMYPNPASDLLHLSSTKKINKVEVYAMNGLMVISTEDVGTSIDLKELQSGMYFVKIYEDEGEKNMKFIKM